MSSGRADSYSSIDVTGLRGVIEDLEQSAGLMDRTLPGLRRDFEFFGVDTANLTKLSNGYRELTTVVEELWERHNRAEVLLADYEGRGLAGADSIVRFPGDLLDGDHHVTHEIHHQDGRTPGDVHTWWEGLTDTERAYAISYYPDTVGSLNGVPIAARDQANRRVIMQEYTRMSERLAELEAGAPIDFYPDEPNPLPFYLDEGEHLKERLGGLDVIIERLDDQPGRPRAYLIDISTDGLGRAVVSIGNPDEADNVATYIPGTGSRLSDGLATDIRRTDRMLEAADRFAPESTTSLIMWLGYDAPQDVFAEAPSPSLADKASDNVRNFQEALRTTHLKGRSHNTLLGHSYGSTVIGRAAREGDIHVDNLVFIASPGVGVGHVSDLGIDPDRVFATRAKWDLIKATPRNILGPQPTGGGFGATHFRSDNSNPLAGHSDYWESQLARRNLAYIIIGWHDEVN
ncbi:alpha/beta hydrolase [Phytoactinopolyspora limicola]|uniref:alpha/beta hydrolase n=1 Tax=Phytoactinopolyspora limicola TaxID=2715536 RepID=UPI00140D8CC0|nr:alpha/beta hydrolase [Phytoactinopolyspora limicola]